MSDNLTPKQARFVEEYLTIGEVSDLLQVSTKQAIRPRGYYVYALADSRGGEVFYIGKGKGLRYTRHVAEWRAGKWGNAHKISRIEAILAAKGRVDAYLLWEGLEEPEAFSKERQAISAVGLSRLTNTKTGLVSEFERAATQARALLERVIPEAEWKMTNEPSAEKIVLRRAVVEGLRRCLGEQSVGVWSEMTSLVLRERNADRCSQLATQFLKNNQSPQHA